MYPVQGSDRSWKTWKVREFIISTSRPGKSWNLGEGHGKSWKGICFLRIKRQKDKKSKKITDEFETGFNFGTNGHKQAFYPL